MPKSVVETSRPQGDQDADAGLAIAPVRPNLRLARRHRLSKARGVLLGVVIGLVVWSLVAALLYGFL